MFDLESRDRAYIIAEAGTCHAAMNGTDAYHKALIYVLAAAKAGADAVKFQMFNAPTYDNMFCWMDGDEERAVRWCASRMPLDSWGLVQKLANHCDIDLLVSVFEHTTVQWVKELKMPAVKVASRAALTFPYGELDMPHLVSNGMGSVPPHREDTVSLQCEANYPSVRWWDHDLPGFSDHSGTTHRGIDAIENGCSLVEVHFYVDPDDAGPDLPASLSVDALAIICAIRDAQVKL